jgi:uncharacterized membrane protein YphA (DoxX/SURF4 family)
MNFSTLLLHPSLIILVRWLLAFIFLASALGKLRDRRGFISIVLDYQVLPKRWARRFAIALPWLEMALGLMLLLGLGTRIAAMLSGLLLLTFIGAMGVNLRRGRKDLNCGCAGARQHQKISGRLILRNAILLLLSLQIMLWGQDSPAVQGVASSLMAFLMTHMLLVGGGLPLTLAIAGSLMLALLFRQVRRFVHMEARR